MSLDQLSHASRRRENDAGQSHEQQRQGAMQGTSHRTQRSADTGWQYRSRCSLQAAILAADCVGRIEFCCGGGKIVPRLLERMDAVNRLFLLDPVAKFLE